MHYDNFEASVIMTTVHQLCIMNKIITKYYFRLTKQIHIFSNLFTLGCRIPEMTKTQATNNKNIVVIEQKPSCMASLTTPIITITMTMA